MKVGSPCHLVNTKGGHRIPVQALPLPSSLSLSHILCKMGVKILTSQGMALSLNSLNIIHFMKCLLSKVIV